MPILQGKPPNPLQAKGTKNHSTSFYSPLSPIPFLFVTVGSITLLVRTFSIHVAAARGTVGSIKQKQIYGYLKHRFRSFSLKDA